LIQFILIIKVQVIRNMGMVRFFNPHPLLGHEWEEWDPQVPGDLEKIKKYFKEKIKAGFRAFALLKDGTSKPITQFDEEAERIMLTASKVILQPAATRG